MADQSGTLSAQFKDGHDFGDVFKRSSANGKEEID
jgi:hypothetical protein